MKFGSNLPIVSEEKSFEIVDGRRTTAGRRTTEPAYTISSPGAFGSGELKYKVTRSVKLNKYQKYDAHLLDRARYIRQKSMGHLI